MHFSLFAADVLFSHHQWMWYGQSLLYMSLFVCVCVLGMCVSVCVYVCVCYQWTCVCVMYMYILNGSCDHWPILILESCKCTRPHAWVNGLKGYKCQCCDCGLILCNTNIVGTLMLVMCLLLDVGWYWNFMLLDEQASKAPLMHSLFSFFSVCVCVSKKVQESDA